MTLPTFSEPAAMVDLTGLTCPGPILGAREILEGLRDGQVLLLLSDCPGTRDDLFAWAEQTRNNILKTEAMPDGGTGYYIMKGKGTEREANVILDIRGVLCPGPIVEAKKLLNGMNSGEILKLVSNCPGISADVADWVKATGLRLVASEETGPGEFEFYIGK